LADQARFRINLSQREFEVEGSETFVAHWTDRLEDILGLFGPAAAMAEHRPGPPSGPDTPDLGPFGAFIQRLSNNASEVDRMLAAGFWLQHRSTDDAFATGEASRLLSDHGVRIGNPSQCVRQSLMARRVFLVQKGRYRISQQGRAYLERQVGQVPEPAPSPP
jgi:hypothetical protein